VGSIACHHSRHLRDVFPRYDCGNVTNICDRKLAEVVPEAVTCGRQSVVQYWFPNWAGRNSFSVVLQAKTGLDLNCFLSTCLSFHPQIRRIHWSRWTFRNQLVPYLPILVASSGWKTPVLCLAHFICWVPLPCNEGTFQFS
jgi:hypothetical protein